MNPLNFFQLANDLVHFSPSYPDEILFRTAINRLYYGMFHLIQQELGISIPKEQRKRIHKYVKEKIEGYPFIGDYMKLEEFRVDADYFIASKKANIQDFNEALKLKDRISISLQGTGNIGFESDDDFFFRTKTPK